MLFEYNEDLNAALHAIILMMSVLIIAGLLKLELCPQGICIYAVQLFLSVASVKLDDRFIKLIMFTRLVLIVGVYFCSSLFVIVTGFDWLDLSVCVLHVIITFFFSFSVLQRLVSCRARWHSASHGASLGLSAMRGRCSRKLSLLAKAGFLLWLLWLGYVLLAPSSFPSTALDQVEDKDKLVVRQLTTDESRNDGQLARPLYLKSAPNSNAPGEWGRATHLTLSAEEKKQEQDSVESYAINIYVSDKISLHRHIQDQRMNEWVEGKLDP